MTQQNINLGTGPNTGTGDPLQVAMTKTQANFTDLYSKFPISIANGGTGQASAAPAFDALAAAAAALGLTNVNNLLFGLQSPNVRNANYILALTDVAGIVEHTDSSSSYTYTIPLHSSVAWPTTYAPHIKILNNSSGTLALAPASGVTLTRADGTSGTGSRTIGANSSAIIYAIAQDSWIVEGSALS